MWHICDPSGSDRVCNNNMLRFVPTFRERSSSSLRSSSSHRNPGNHQYVGSRENIKSKINNYNFSNPAINYFQSKV